MEIEGKFINLNAENTSNYMIKFMNDYGKTLNRPKKKNLKNSEISNRSLTNLNFSHSNFSQLHQDFSSNKKLPTKPYSNNWIKKFLPDLKSNKSSAENSSLTKNKFFQQKNNGNDKKFQEYYPENLPNTNCINEILSNDYDETINNFLKNMDFNNFLQTQVDRFERLKELSDYIRKEIESNITEKNAFIVDFLKLLSADYHKIINNFIKGVTLFKTPSRLENSSYKTKKLNISEEIGEILALLQRIYPCKINDVGISNVMLKSLQEELDKKKNSLRTIGNGDFRAYSYIVDLEKYIKYMFCNNENQEAEIQKLLKEISTYEQFHDDNYCILAKNKTDEMITHLLKTETVSQRFEFFQNKMSVLDALSEKIKGLENKIALQNEEIENKKKIICDLEEKVKELHTIINTKPIKHHKQTQATNYQSDIGKGDLDPNILKPYNQNNIGIMLEGSSVGFNMGYECSFAIMSLILSDKLVYDYNSLQETKQTENLKNYLFHWFAIKLGQAKISQQLLTDFLSSIMVERLQRFKIFTDLLGLEWDEITARGGIQKVSLRRTGLKVSKKEINSLKKIFVSSAYCCKILLRTLFLLKYSPLKTIDKYSPLSPMQNNDLSSFNFDIFFPVFKQILNDEGFSSEEIMEEGLAFEDHFMNNNDLSNKRGSLSPTLYDRIKSSVLERTNISLDNFLTYVLETFFKIFQKKVELIVKSLEISLSSKTFVNVENVCFDDFKAAISKTFIGKSKIWYDNLFAKFCWKNNSYPSATLKEKILNIADHFLTVESYFSTKSNQIEIPNEVERKNLKKTSPKRKITENEILTKGKTLQKIEFEDEFNYENFDIVNNLIVLYEVYNLISGVILKQESKSENLYITHQLFKKEFLKLPSTKIFKNTGIYSKTLNDFDRRELIEKIDKIWTQLRSILDLLSVEKTI